MRLLAAPLLALAVVVSLAGCITVQLPPSAAPGQDQVTPSPSASVGVTCGEDVALLNSPGEYRIDGDCDQLTLEGVDITVSAGDVDALIIRGDRVTVTADDIDSVDLAGNDNTVALEDADRITIAGDRNTLQGSEFDAVTIRGNDNTLSAAVVDTLDDSGDRNVVGPR